MKNSKPIITVLSALLFNLMVAVMFASITEGVIPVWATFTVLTILAIRIGSPENKPRNYGVLNMAIQKEIWSDTLIKILFKDTSFLQWAFNEDKYVLAGKVVHIPRATGSVEVIKNRMIVPAQPVKRTREDVTYALDEYTATPIYIPDADKIELSFDAIAEALREIRESIESTVADELLYLWRPTLAGNIIRTTGAAVDGVDGQTGQRKMFKKEQLKAIRKHMNKAKLPKTDRKVLLDSEFFEQLMDDEDLKKRDNSLELDMAGGVVTRLYGFDIAESPGVLTYNNAGTPVAQLPGAEMAADSNIGALAWHKDAVSRAKGEIKMFDQTDSPEYYGDMYSALCRMGGRVRRDDGVYSIVQATA